MGRQTLGHIKNYPVGSHFENRRDVAEAGLHRARQAGICGTPYAESIVLNQGYVDDEDYGSVVIYTGHGGRDTRTKQQVADQDLTRGNRALARSSDEGLPVRVLRGAAGAEEFSPAAGFRYDGLYMVADYWTETGQDGYRIYRYRLEAIPGEASWSGEPLSAGESVAVTEVVTGTKEPPAGNENPGTQVSTNGTVQRDPAVAQWVKDLYGNACQMCGITVRTPAGTCSEASHIQALGRPHNGPDVVGNVLCLCPNCHVAFDSGAYWLTDSLEIFHFQDGYSGTLKVHPEHKIALECVAQHRARFT